MRQNDLRESYIDPTSQNTKGLPRCYFEETMFTHTCEHSINFIIKKKKYKVILSFFISRPQIKN